MAASSMKLKETDISCSGRKVRRDLTYEVEDARPTGRSKKTWTQDVQKDCQARKLNREDALDCTRWKKQITDD